MKPKSKIGKINWKDAVQGALVAALAVPATCLIGMLSAGTAITIPVLILAGKAGAGAGLGYLLKSLMQNSEGKILVKEPEQSFADKKD